MKNIQQPQHRLDKQFIKASIINELIESVIFFLVLAVLFYLNHLFNWPFWIGWILIGITVIMILSTIWSLLFRPFLLYRNNRYEVDENFLQLKSGALFERHELVPMTKIQSVETNQGPIMRKFGLYALSVETMGSSHGINGLPESRALEVRSQIAQYAKIKEVES